MYGETERRIIFYEMFIFFLSFTMPNARLSGIDEQSHASFDSEIVIGYVYNMGGIGLAAGIKHTDHGTATNILSQ